MTMCILEFFKGYRLFSILTFFLSCFPFFMMALLLLLVVVVAAGVEGGVRLYVPPLNPPLHILHDKKLVFDISFLYTKL